MKSEFVRIRTESGQFYFSQNQGERDSRGCETDGKGPLRADGQKQQGKRDKAQRQGNQAAVPFQLTGLTPAQGFVFRTDRSQKKNSDDGEHRERTGYDRDNAGRDRKNNKSV